MLHRFARYLLGSATIVLSVVSYPVLAETSVSDATPFGAVYTDEHPSLAALPENTRSNSYYFNITKTSGHPVVIAEARKEGDDSNGNVILLADGKSFVLGEWTKKNILKGELRFDASKYITKPGKYEGS